jgi:hypothetical protein
MAHTDLVSVVLLLMSAEAAAALHKLLQSVVELQRSQCMRALLELPQASFQC